MSQMCLKNNNPMNLGLNQGHLDMWYLFSWFLRDISFDVGIMPVGSDCPFHGDGGSFVPQCGTCTIDYVRTNYRVLCARASM